MTGRPASEFMRLWDEERQRQIVNDVPQGREAVMDVRAVRVLARLRGCPPPKPDQRWDDAAAARYSEPGEVEAVLESYAAAFVDLTSAPPEIGPLLERLARRYRIGIVSNWPLTLSIERFVEAAGWTAHLSAVVVSPRVGCIKPWPEIFLAAARELGAASGPGILHVGDDLGADVAGAAGVGWRTAWIRSRPEDSPLPVAPVPEGLLRDELAPDLTLDRVTEIETALGSGRDGAAR